MGLTLALRGVLRLLASALIWTIIFVVALSFLTNGNALRTFAASVYVFLTLFSYFGALFTAFAVNRLVRQRHNYLLAVIVSIAAFLAMFFAIQSVSALMFDVIVGPNDGSIDINHIEILPRDIAL